MKVYSRRQTILLKKIERKIRRSYWITQTCRDRDSKTGRCFATQYYNLTETVRKICEIQHQMDNEYSERYG